VRAAAEAETLRLRAMARRMASRAVLAVVAILFMLAALVLVHVAAVLALAGHMDLLQAVLIVLALDLVVAVVLGLLAAHSAPSAAEREALVLRREAWRNLRQDFMLASVVSILVRLLRRRS
jgi:hypothetical protein